VTQLGADVIWITYGSFHCDECLSASIQLQCVRQNCIRLASAHALTFRPWTSVEEMEVVLKQWKAGLPNNTDMNFFNEQVFDEVHPLGFQ